VRAANPAADVRALPEVGFFVDGVVLAYDDEPVACNLALVKKMIMSLVFAIDNQRRMVDNVYNVGSDEMNYSKKEVCEIIRTHVPKVYFDYSGGGEDEDKRNYQVCYDKINQLGFRASITIDQGIEELIKTVEIISIDNPYYNVLK
jgi:nucleoside-diphosphate-sugar epimerase